MSTDEELIIAHRRGNPTAFGILYERHQSVIQRRIRKQLRQVIMQNDVDDLVQDAFTRLHTDPTDFACENQAVLAHLRVYADRIAADYLKYRLRKRRDVRRTMPLTRQPFAPQQDAQRDVAELLSALPAAEAQVVRLMDVEGHTAKSAAELLGVPTTTVQWRHRRAMERLQA